MSAPFNDWAFPHTIEGNQGPITYQGMTLRDYFAATAPAHEIEESCPTTRTDAAAHLGIKEADYTIKDYVRLIAMLRYQYADAMLAERAK